MKKKTTTFLICTDSELAITEFWNALERTTTGYRYPADMTTIYYAANDVARDNPELFLMFCEAVGSDSEFAVEYTALHPDRLVSLTRRTMKYMTSLMTHLAFKTNKE